MFTPSRPHCQTFNVWIVFSRRVSDVFLGTFQNSPSGYFLLSDDASHAQHLTAEAQPRELHDPVARTCIHKQAFMRQKRPSHTVNNCVCRLKRNTSSYCFSILRVTIVAVFFNFRNQLHPCRIPSDHTVTHPGVRRPVSDISKSTSMWLT